MLCVRPNPLAYWCEPSNSPSSHAFRDRRGHPSNGSTLAPRKTLPAAPTVRGGPHPPAYSAPSEYVMAPLGTPFMYNVFDLPRASCAANGGFRDSARGDAHPTRHRWSNVDASTFAAKIPSTLFAPPLEPRARGRHEGQGPVEAGCKRWLSAPAVDFYERRAGTLIRCFFGIMMMA